MPSKPPSIVTIERAAETSRTYTVPKSRAGSGGSESVHSRRTDGSGGTRYSGSGSGDSTGDWSVLDHDDIEPSDSASRSRQSSSRRYTTESRPEPTRRHSSRRIRVQEEEEQPRRRQSSRRQHKGPARRADSHRTPSDESSIDTVASFDDYPPQGHHGMPPPRGYPQHPSYRHVPPPGHGGYPPSVVTSGPGFPEGYGARQALVHMPQQDAFGYPVHGNPFSPQDPQSNPFSPMSATSGSSYFGIDPHAPPMQHHPRPPAPPRPQSYAAPSSHYGSEVMSPYGHPGMPPYPGYHMAPMPGYPPMSWYPSPPQQSSPPPSEAEGKKKSQEFEALQAILTKTEEAREAFRKELLAKAEADAAAAAEKKAREEEEKKRKEEVADASKKAKEAAEKKAEEAAKKAKEEADKKLKELEEAKEEAVKKQKELEEETKKLKPPDHAGKSIRFKDAMGRKFSFPFHLCKTWKGMEGLIKQAFLQIDVIGEHVRQGHYDLTGPDGEIILPQVWENMVQPDWDIEMHMWPGTTEEKGKGKAKGQTIDDLMDPLGSLGLGDLGDLGIMDPGGKKSKKAGVKKKTRAGDAHIVTVGPSDPLPPPPHFPAGVMPDPLSMAFAGGAVEIVKDKPKAKKKPSNNAWAGWFAGTSAPPRSKKDDEKLELVRHKSARSNGSVKSGRSRSSSANTASAAKRNPERASGCAVM